MSVVFNSLKKHQFIAVVVVVVLISIALSTIIILTRQDTAMRLNDGTGNDSASQSSLDQHTVTAALPSESVLINTPISTENQLLYLIEEEKLAHDVYLAMYEKYGARVFGNILKSENNHQSRVLTLLESRNIPDPRSETVGVFTNQSLQKLYNDLIAQGNQSLTEAYKVGVAIEELDIADIKEDLSTLDPSQTDVKSALEALLRGSENHLRAFSRQVR